MLEQLKAAWRQFRDSEPGRRFQDQKDRQGGAHRHPPVWQKALVAVLGVALVVGGVALLPLPGPGMVVVALGLALLSWASRRVTVFLDRAELWLRAAGRALRAWWDGASMAVRVLVVAVAALLSGGAAYGVYAWLLA